MGRREAGGAGAAEKLFLREELTNNTNSQYFGLPRLRSAQVAQYRFAIGNSWRRYRERPATLTQLRNLDVARQSLLTSVALF